jgi:hypothetical protein
MSEPIENQSCCNSCCNSCCSPIFYLNDLWENNKYEVSSKLSIILGILGSTGSILLGFHLMVPASVILGLMNVGVFFAGIALSKYEIKNKILEKDNESLKQEITKRFTILENFKFPVSENNGISEISSQTTPTPYEKVVKI